MPSPKVAVVIATKDRPQLLSERALSSVLAQTLQPDYLVVVDDSSAHYRPINREFVTSVNLAGRTYLENTRTQGASGSWNTGLDFLFGQVEDPHCLFVAILDDDDAWAPTYLESCRAAANDRNLDMVAADLRRFDSPDGAPLTNTSPASLLASDFLTSNPGIQGSNLFLRLSALLAAGGFDETLRSTTDRDLCIRLADLGNVRYGRLPFALVDHYADHDRLRLSTRGSGAKLDGLTTFWRKYAGRMTAVQRRAFSERAMTLFDWRPPHEPTPESASEVPKCALVLGLLADSEHPEVLLDIVYKLGTCRDESLVGLDVVLFELKDHSDSIDLAAKVIRDSGAGCFRLTLKRQLEEFPTGLRGRKTERTDEHREILRAYCSRVAETRTGCEVWLARASSARTTQPHGSRLVDILKWIDAARASQKPSMLPHSATEAFDRWIQSDREASAEHRIKHRFALEHIRLLGCGSEAVVWTDERKVYKCIDYWKTRMPRPQLDFLRTQVGRWAGVPGLYTLHEVEDDGPWAVLTYDYETSTPYRGGYESDLLQLLIGCYSVGIVCNNIHPKNLVVSDSGVKLIDYGSDIRPWSPLGFEHMARRVFLTCHYADHPELRGLLRRALTDKCLPELAGYADFRAQVARQLNAVKVEQTGSPVDFGPPPHQPFALYVGVITSDPEMLHPLLDGLASLRTSTSLKRVAALVLDNGCVAEQLHPVVEEARQMGLEVALIEKTQQRLDAAQGAFGTSIRVRPYGQVGISQARTMLQRYLGAILAADQGSFGWVLDDDMRVDERAQAYLPWLPAFRNQGVDVLLGAYEGSSPNPPLNGIRVQLVDLFHNLTWLQSLPPSDPLPNRSSENTTLRKKFPDYYYDLSRKHTGHLETPYWIEPAVRGETVAEAYLRLCEGALGILSGAPLTRPIVANVPSNPLVSAKDSVNRGGCTFILNHRSLTETPNMIVTAQGCEARRSDMIWAIVNRYYRQMNIKAVDFPVRHLGRVTTTPDLNIDKVQGELVGSALYAGLTEFLSATVLHQLDFTPQETTKIRGIAQQYLDRRLQVLHQSFHRVAGLREAIRGVVRPGELNELLGYLDSWFTPKNFVRIRSGLHKYRYDEERFLASLREVADNFASTKVNIDHIQTQFRTRHNNYDHRTE